MASRCLWVFTIAFVMVSVFGYNAASEGQVLHDMMYEGLANIQLALCRT